MHLGLRQRLTGKITQFDRPNRFVSEMVAGAFASLHHVHAFSRVGEGTLMRDTLTWRSPLGPLGVLADWLLVKRHLRRFIAAKQQALKREIEERARSAS